ncbi:19051_t:CDS:1, partial [Racocetra fulgida]
GAWSIMPAYLIELSPPNFRATFSGLPYQLSCLIASSSAQIYAKLGEAFTINENPNYGLAIAIFSVCNIVGVIIFLFGGEGRDLDLMKHVND